MATTTSSHPCGNGTASESRDVPMARDGLCLRCTHPRWGMGTNEFRDQAERPRGR